MEKICMYQHTFPDPNDIVVAKVVNVDTIKSSVVLLEFGMKEGILLHSELSRRRIHSVRKHIKEGKIEVLQVARVDTNKGYIDLSKKHLKPDDIEACLERYRMSKTVHSIVGQVARSRTENNNFREIVAQIYSDEVWPLYDRYEHAYDAFEQIAHGKPIPIRDTDLRNEIVKRLKPQVKNFSRDIQLRCYKPDGIDIIKRSIKKALDKTSMPVKIIYKKAPIYELRTEHFDPADAEQILDTVYREIKKEITQSGGICTTKDDVNAEQKAIRAKFSHHDNNTKRKVGRFILVKK